MLTKQMQKLITQHTLGFVATVNAQGQPNLSPKGTFVVMDEKRLMFSEIRSPNTLKNIKTNPNIEVNFVDPFKRKGVRVKGTARVIEKQAVEFDELFPHFNQWGELTALIRHIIMIEVVAVREMSSPIYDLGADENEIVKVWCQKYRSYIN